MTLALPNDLINDTTADAEKLQENFEAIEQYINNTLADLVADADRVGTVRLWLTGVPAAKDLLLQGQDVSRSTYADLYALWGTTFGAGDGSTTFTLPDFRSRVPFGLDSTQTGNDALGEKGGARDAVVVLHDHTNVHGHDDTFAVAANTVNLAHDHTNATLPTHEHRVGATSISGGYGSTGNPSGWADTGASGVLFGSPGAGGDGISASPLNWFQNALTLPATDTGGPLTTPAIDIPAYSGTGSSSHGHTLNGAVTNYTGDTGETGVAATNANLPPFITVNFVVRALP